MNEAADQARRTAADWIHTYVFARTGDAKTAARVTQDTLAFVDREIAYDDVVTPMRTVHPLHVTGDRGGAA